MRQVIFSHLSPIVSFVSYKFQVNENSIPENVKYQTYQKEFKTH